MKIRRYWQGYLNGTNRGRAVAVIAGRADRLRASVLFYDEAYGAAILKAEGRLDDRTARLQLVRQRSVWAPVQPLDGTLEVRFRDDGSEMEGTWKTDIATEGKLRLRPAGVFEVRWAARRFVIVWRRYLPACYAAALAAFVMASVALKFSISWQALVLLLLPTPALFHARIVAMVTQLGVRKLGPIELQQPPPAAVAVPSRPLDLAGEEFSFAQVDREFVSRTKLLLAWLVMEGTTSRETFDSAARRIGVSGEYLENTHQVLRASGYTEAAGGALRATQLGARYVIHISRVLEAGPVR